MWGWRVFSCPFLGQDRQTDAFSWAIPIRTTRSLPSFAAASRYGGARFLFVLALVEMHHGNLVSLGKPIDRLDIFIADSAKRSRRRNPEFPLPTQERAHLPYRLQ